MDKRVISLLKLWWVTQFQIFTLGTHLQPKAKLENFSYDFSTANRKLLSFLEVEEI